MFRFSENKGVVAQQICGALLPLTESAALAGNQKVLRQLLAIGCKFNDRDIFSNAATLRRNSALYLKLLQVGALYGESGENCAKGKGEDNTSGSDPACYPLQGALRPGQTP